MRAKEFLVQYWDAKAEVKRLEHQLAEIEDLVGNVTVDPTSEHVQKSRDPDQIGELVARKADIESDLDAAKQKALATMQRVINVINMLKEREYRQILQMRYVEHTSWRRIAEDMNYDGRYIYKLYNRALDEMDRILDRTV